MKHHRSGEARFGGEHHHRYLCRSGARGSGSDRSARAPRWVL